MVAGVIPALAIHVAGSQMGAIRRLARVSVPCCVRRPHVSGRLPDGHTPASAVCAVVGLPARVRHIFHIFEVIAVVCPEISEGKEHYDEDQSDNCGQADHDRGHRTIQHGMAYRRRQLSSRGHHAGLPR